MLIFVEMNIDYMKTLTIWIVLFICPFLMKGQGVDSLYIKQVDSLIQVSRSLAANRQFDEALKVNEQAEKIALEILGRESTAYGSCAFNRGRLNHESGNISEAEKWYLVAKEIREKTLGRAHPNFGSCLFFLGILYLNSGNYEKAEKCFLENKEILEKSRGREDMDYANNLNSLGIFYHTLRNYEKAELYYLESKAIKEKALGREDPNYARTLNNLGILYRDLGKFEKAESYYLEVKDIMKKTQGHEHPDYAQSLNNLADLWENLGNYEKSKAYYLEAKDILEKTLGREHPKYASCLNSLSTVIGRFPGNFEKAEAYQLQAKEIWEKTIGKEHPNYIGCIINLASSYYGNGNFDKAEILLIEAKEIFESRINNREHIFYIHCLNNLGILYSDQGKYEKAEAYFLQAKEIWEKTLGREHPLYVNVLDILAHHYEIQYRYNECTPLLAEAMTLSQTRIIDGISFLSERELAQYAASQQKGSFLNSYLISRPDDHIGILPGLSYNQSLFRKGFLMQSAVRLQQLTSTSTHATAINNDLKGFHRRIAQQLSLPIAQREDVEVLREKANAFEKELARTVAGYGEAMRQVDWREVQANLKEREAAIEFVHFRFFKKNQTDSIIYAALLLKSGEKQPKFIPLFEEKTLDSVLHSNLDRKADYVNSLYTLADRGAIAVETPKKSLYDLIWKPIEKELNGIKTIYYSPSGLLHRINLDAIPVSETETLADRCNLIELNSTRQLVIPTQIKNANNDAVLFGGIQFEKDSIIQNNELPIDIGIASRSRGEVSFNSIDSTLRGGSWNYLAGTEREVDAIEKIMLAAGVAVQLKKAYDATEESFKNIGANNNASPRILHIATHGYFFPDLKEKSKSNAMSGQNEPVFKISDHPMLRSGLIMAGGNAAWQGKQTPDGREDGILTAYEISQMNLSNTELVVLSACETGLGDIQGNEGVYGLQRAFKIAGVKYIIMSLWQVPDKQTSMLMTTFYKKWLEAEGPAKGGNKMSIPDAFHAAQKEMREMGFDPYQWAGFVLIE